MNKTLFYVIAITLLILASFSLYVILQNISEEKIELVYDGPLNPEVAEKFEKPKNLSGNELTLSKYNEDYKEAGEIVLKFAEKQQLRSVTLNKIIFESGLYFVNLSVDARSNPVYLTSDKKYLVPSVVQFTQLMNVQAYKTIVQNDNPISIDQAGRLALKYSEYQGVDATLGYITEENGLYHIDLKINEYDTPVYITPDGKYILPSLVSIEDYVHSTSSPTSSLIDKHIKEPISRVERPNVELFVTPYNPYSIQAQKSFITLMKVFNESDTADLNLRFIHFFLDDGDEEEVLIQVCIREEQSDKYISYLEEFLASGNPQVSMLKSNIYKNDVFDCIDEGRANEYYTKDSELSKQSIVKGSPTLIINGIQSDADRNEAAYLNEICNAFITPPDFCGTLELNTKNPSPNFGEE